MAKQQLKSKASTPAKKVASGTNKYLTSKNKKAVLKKEIGSAKVNLTAAAKTTGYKPNSPSAKRLDKATSTAKRYGKATGKNIMTGKKLKKK